MASEVRLIIAKNEARLTLTSGDKVLEDELWKFDSPLTASGARELARILFDEGYDLMQFSLYGD